jgi:hypothetical protein
MKFVRRMIAMAKEPSRTRGNLNVKKLNRAKRAKPTLGIPIGRLTRSVTGIADAPREKTARQLLEDALIARYRIKR